MHSKFHPVFGSSHVQFRSTAKAVTPCGGLVSLIEFFNRIGLAGQLQKAMPASPKLDPSSFVAVTERGF